MSIPAPAQTDPRKRGSVSIAVILIVAAVALLLLGDMMNRVSDVVIQRAWIARKQATVDKRLISKIARDTVLDYVVLRPGHVANATIRDADLRAAFIERMNPIIPCESSDSAGSESEVEDSRCVIESASAGETELNLASATIIEVPGTPTELLDGADGETLAMLTDAQNRSAVFMSSVPWKFRVRKNDPDGSRHYEVTCRVFYASPASFAEILYFRPSCDGEYPATGTCPTAYSAANAETDSRKNVFVTVPAPATRQPHHIAYAENTLGYEARPRLDMAWSYWDWLLPSNQTPFADATPLHRGDQGVSGVGSAEDPTVIDTDKIGTANRYAYFATAGETVTIRPSADPTLANRPALLAIHGSGASTAVRFDDNGATARNMVVALNNCQITPAAPGFNSNFTGVLITTPTVSMSDAASLTVTGSVIRSHKSPTPRISVARPGDASLISRNPMLLPPQAFVTATVTEIPY